MNKVNELFESDKFAKLCSISIDEISEGFAKTSVTVKQEHLNGLNMTQGGLIYTLADTAFAASANSFEQKAVSTNINMSYFKKTKEGDTLIAKARVISKSKKLCTVDVLVECDDVLIAKMIGTAYIL